MAYYNLAAEYASLIIISLATVSFLLDQSKGTTRYGALKWLQLGTLVSIVVTIGSLVTADFYMNYPLWVVDILKYLYFLTAPIAAPLALFYGITLTYHKTYRINFFKKYIWAWLPYVIYCIIILTNGLHRLIFTISPSEGYIRGGLFRITYVIALVYFLLIIYLTVINFKTPHRKSLLIICLNLFISSLIFCAQLLIPQLQLSGLASVTGVLIIQFYVQNVSHNSDALTELYNRAALTNLMTRLCKSRTSFTLFVFSIRNFKGINERNGLMFGDALLEEISLRLRVLLPHRDVFRYSGDEFAVLMHEQDYQYINKIDEIFENLNKSYTVDGIIISVDFIYARVDYPRFGTKPQDIISSVDYSLSLIKKGVGNISFVYDVGICEQMKRRNYVIERIKKALDTDGFEAYYQPIYCVKKSEFTLAEALIRFKPEQGEFISPGEFIPIAEDTGLIIRITKTMLNLVCCDYQKLINILGNNTKLAGISINFPYVMFMKNGSAKEVYEIVNSYNLSPDMIKIELTERTLATDIENTLKIMNEFIKLGFVFELDDFGVEYSNFSMFFSIPIRMIKFDRSLVVSSAEDEDRRDFFNKFLTAVKALDNDIEVIMEGVEDDEVKQFLINCGSDYIQGYVYSKPLPINEFIRFLS